MGLEDGERPDFSFPRAWIYADNAAVVHLIGVDLDDPSGLQRYVDEEIRAEALQGSGAFDHVAFRANDPSVLIEYLKKTDYEYCERQVPNMDLFQFYRRS